MLSTDSAGESIPIRNSNFCKWLPYYGVKGLFFKYQYPSLFQDCLEFGNNHNKSRQDEVLLCKITFLHSYKELVSPEKIHQFLDDVPLRQRYLLPI
jgi:hypothetical protein